MILENNIDNKGDRKKEFFPSKAKEENEYCKYSFKGNYYY